MLEHDKFPWISGNLQITAVALESMQQHALEDYPNECCGYVSGPTGNPLMLDEAVPVPNLAVEDSHTPDLPTDRTANDYFVMDSLKVDAAMTAGEQQGRPVKVIYHSHPNGRAYFSQKDREIFGESRELSLPVSFIVVGVAAEQDEQPVVVETRLWVFDALQKLFVESRLSEI